MSMAPTSASMLGSKPFGSFGEKSKLIDAVVGACNEHLGIDPTLDTGGGTSDGRFIAPTGAEVVELGPLNDSIHKVDEWVQVTDLEPLTRTYLGVIERLLA